MTRIKKCICILLCMTMICGTISFSIEADATESSNVTGETESVLTGKSILFAGDSITKAGTDDGDRVGWAQIIGDTYNMTWTNAGVSGASISTVRNNRVLTQLEANKETSYDYVILHGGVNDAWNSASVGAISTSFDVDVFDTSTFAGGLEELFYYACKYYEGARIGYIVNFAMPNSSVENLRDMSAYFNVAEQICDKWNIPYIDLYSGSVEVEGQTLSYSYDILQVDECTQDTIGPCFADTSVHLNGKGYDAISPYIAKWIETIEEAGTFDSVLSDKSILFVGDSITDGAKDTYTADRENHGDGWAGRIGTMYNMTWNNAGLSGASVSTVKDDRVLTQIENNKDTSYDYVILHGGVNDAMQGAPVGTMSDSVDVTAFDKTTFAGAFEELIYYAREYYKDAKIGYIVNYATPNATWGDGKCKDMSAYFDVAKQICDKWEVPYIDLYEGRVYVDGVSLSYSYDILKVDTGEYMFKNDPDEVHIGAKGYDVITPYIARWIETLADTVEAATPEGVDYIVEKHTNISAYRTYRTDNAFSMPTIVKTETTGEWLFAGWYKDVNCTSAIKSSVKGMVVDGEYYAKFVSADVLSVKCQISKDTTFDSPSTILRCVSSVDSLKYSKIGFDLITPDGTKKNVESRSVGTRIKVTEDNQKDSYSYSPKVIDTESEYFYSAMEEISQENFEKGYVVKPYWITKDGTKVYGVSRYVKVSEGIDNGSESDVIHMPIKMNVEPEVGSTLTVQDMGVANFVKYDDNGYAHYALNVPNKSALKSVTQYTVKDGDKTSTYIYRNLNTKYTGSGTQDTTWYDGTDDEFVIATSADLYGLASIVGNGSPLTSKTIYLVSDITINDMTVQEMLSNDSGVVSWLMIGKNKENYFNGQFDGQGHTISGLYGNNNNGMFGYAAECTIKNFSLKNSVFTGSFVGSIAYQFDGVMENVYSDAYITCSSAQYNFGGMIGRLTNSGAGGRQPGTSKSSISDCWFDGTINITYNGAVDLNCGGIVGNRAAGSGHTVNNCLFTGVMTINHTTENATSEKSINVGGILGGTGSQTCEVAGCFSAGSANVTVVDTTHFIKKIGAIAGSGTGVTIKADSCVYAKEPWEDRIIYDDAKNANAISLVGKDINTYESYLNMPGLDYYKSSNKTGHWVVRESGIPVLKTFADEWIDVAWYYDNIGSDSYSIATAQELYGLSVLSQGNSFGDKTINITKNIVMNSGKATDWADGKNLDNLRSWTPIGMSSSYPFKGTLNGNGYTVSGIYCKSPSGVAGFIGRLVGGTLQNIQLTNSYVSRGGDHVGGVVGFFNGGAVESVCCDAIVNQTNADKANVGGIIGYCAGTTNVTKCWFDGTVESQGIYVGGIVGYINSGSARITDCLMTGKVLSDYTESEMCTGGIVGGCGKAYWYLTRCLMAGQMNAAATTKTAIAPLVGSPALADDSSTRTRKITNSYATTAGYAALIGAESNVVLTDSDFVESSKAKDVPNLFVGGSTTWKTDEDGYAVLNF